MKKAIYRKQRIINACKSIGIPKKVERYAIKLASKTSIKEYLEQGFAGGCLYSSCYKNKYPISQWKIANNVGISTVTLRKCATDVAREFGIIKDNFMERESLAKKRISKLDKYEKEILKLYNDGKSDQEIANLYGVIDSTVQFWRKEWNLPPPTLRDYYKPINDFFRELSNNYKVSISLPIRNTSKFKVFLYQERAIGLPKCFGKGEGISIMIAFVDLYNNLKKDYSFKKSSYDNNRLRLVLKK